jgi:bifunctional non-homologous end joining protein LigD
VEKKRLRVGGKDLELTNLDKVMYPETRFTKGQVIDYYTRVSRHLLAHLKDRPITRIRFPNGVTGEHFYEKNAPAYTPKWIKTFAVPRTSVEATTRYILIDDLPTLVWLANMATLEIHPFLARAPRVEMPTMVVFDLDPGEGADISASCEVALLIRELLDRLKLESFVKVSGSKGIHLHVPLNTPVTYDATQPFAKSIAEALEREHPDLVISEMTKAKRKGKVFVDWSQNSERKSTVAVYSLRAKRETPFVALPISWDELKNAAKKGGGKALFFEPDECLRRLEKRGDLFAPALKLKQKLPQPFMDLQNGDAAGPRARDGSLETYRAKRDFSVTPEPPPAIKSKSKDSEAGRLFVIQKHDASHLHYDLRLEMHGVLKSWAVPKGPPYELAEKRLAMAVEDHPMEYARFEGIIPEGQYGGGTVMVWDIGTYDVMDGNYWQGKLHVVFHGKKLKGEWVLVRSGESDGKKQSWLLIKAGASMKPLSARQDDASALTRRSMAAIAAARDAVWHSNRNGGGKQPPPATATIDLDALPEADARFIEPMQCRPVDKLPSGGDWLYEIKLDGYRCLAVKRQKKASLYSRNRKSFDKTFPEIVQALAPLESGTVLDGEVVALDSEGRPSFNALQDRRASAANIFYYVFDVPVYRGKNLFGVALEERRRLLESIATRLAAPVRLSQIFTGATNDLISAARNLRLEGLVAKRKDSNYEPGRRSGAWIKYRINQGQEFVVGGYIPGADGFQSLLAGYYEGDKLQFIAKIKNGFVPRVKREIAERFEALATDVCPFANLPEKKGARRGEALTAAAMKRCRWLKPELVVQVEFADWTAANHLRHARFVGLREDKAARKVVREYAAAESGSML